jgi:hypothetical protein
MSGARFDRERQDCLWREGATACAVCCMRQMRPTARLAERWDKVSACPVRAERHAQISRLLMQNSACVGVAYEDEHGTHR